MRTALLVALVILALCLLSLPALAGATVIDGVEPLEGPDPLVKALGRAIRIAVDPKLTDDYLYGLSGSAFLATVCANNCTCRDYRELALSVDATLASLGISFEHFEGGDEACWERIKASIDAGVPVVGWNAFGDFEDNLICGYDEEQDLLYGWSTQPDGKEYATGSISEWKGGGMYGYIISRGKKEQEPVDRKKLEAEQLALAVMMARRPPLEGG